MGFIHNIVATSAKLFLMAPTELSEALLTLQIWLGLGVGEVFQLAVEGLLYLFAVSTFVAPLLNHLLHLLDLLFIF